MTDYVSIIMLTYRRGSHDRDEMAKASITSLLENTTYPFELILLDNTQNNRGIAAGRNFGYGMATGKYVAFVDDDILLLPGWLEECVRMVEMGDKFIATPVIQRLIKKWELPNFNGIRNNMRTGSNCMVMRRKDFLDIGYFNTFERGLVYEASKTGREFANRVTNKGYSFLICSPAKAMDMGVGKHSYE